jgi:hypothetical protein
MDIEIKIKVKIKDNEFEFTKEELKELIRELQAIFGDITIQEICPRTILIEPRPWQSPHRWPPVTVYSIGESW